MPWPSSAHPSPRRVCHRRARLLRFLAPWTVRGGGYEVRVGLTRPSAEVLSDDALEDLAACVIADFWADRRRARENRPFLCAALLGAAQRLGHIDCGFPRRTTLSPFSPRQWYGLRE